MKIHLILTFVLAFAGSLTAKLEDHFKPCPNKSDVHQMRNIDFIYTINLDQRPEKFTGCLEELQPYGIIPYRFSAVDARELSLSTINDVGVCFDYGMNSGKMGTYYSPWGNGSPAYENICVLGRTYFGQGIARSVIAIILSHLSILQDAYDSGYETIWLMEDDIQVIQDPRVISELIDKLDALVGTNGWDILCTDKDTKNKRGKYVQCLGYAWRPNFTPDNMEHLAERRDVSDDFIKLGARYGAYSMIIRRSGMKKILDFFKTYKIFVPYDFEFFLHPDINMYTVNDDVVSTIPTAISDNDALPLGPVSFPFKIDYVAQTKKIKQTAFQAMDQLQGWCSKEKASTLMDLVMMTRPKTVVEIGVFGGKSLIPIGYALWKNGTGKVYGIDSWDANESVRGMDESNATWWASVDHEAIRLDLESKIQLFNLKQHVKLIQATSKNTAPILDIDLLHIDGNHSEESTLFDVNKWVPLVKKGGVVLFNDMNWASCEMAVQWLDEHCIRLAETSEGSTCGIWVKP